jgi:hypothetical protein
MKDDAIELSTTSTPTGYVRATLTIPEHAVRVIASPPETLTQRNVEAVTGLPARKFLELIRSPGFPLRVRHIGKLRVVNRAAFVQWLEDGEPKRDLAESLVRQVHDEPTSENEQHGRTNELLASVGLRERAPKRRARRKR